MPPSTGNPANTPQATSAPWVDPQGEPSILVDDNGKQLSGIFIEEVTHPDGILEIKGWKFGPVEFRLVSGSEDLSLEITDSIRGDVQEAFSLDSEECGFVARTGKVEAGTDYHFLWRFDPAQEFLRSTLRLQENGSKIDAVGSSAPPAASSGKPGGKSGINVDFVAGSQIVGWSLFDGSPAALKVTLGGSCLGRIPTTLPREDVRQLFEIDDPKLGFQAGIGGLMQFASLTERCDAFSVEQTPESSLSRSILLEDVRDQLDLFSPMTALREDERMANAWARDIRATRHDRCLFLFQTSSENETGDLTLEFFQEIEPGQVKQVDRSTLSGNGELVQVEARLHSIEQPLLIVVTSGENEILLTDVIPLPILLLPENAQLIEVESILAGGLGRYQSAARLNRHYLFQRLRYVSKSTGAGSLVPTRRNTAVILFDRRANDPLTEVDFEVASGLFDVVLCLDRESGVLRQEDGTSRDTESLFADSTLTHFLLLDRTAALRPDFWEILAGFSEQWTDEIGLAYGNSMVVNGLEPPYLVRHSILNHPTFRRHQLVDLKSAIVTRSLLKETVTTQPEEFAAGLLRLESFFAEIGDDRLLHLPVVLDQSIHESATKVTRKFFSDQQVPLPFTPRPTPGYEQEGGLSVIVEFCNEADQTLRCLDSLALQDFPGELEVILVDSRSTPTYSRQVVAHAQDLLGNERVQFLEEGEDIPALDRGAAAASRKFLFFLSQHCLLISPNLLAEAREITAVPWVGTCGVRIVGKGEYKGLRARSVGLRGIARPPMIPGSPILAANTVPTFLENGTLEVLANSFEAVCVRKEVYDSLDGLADRSHAADFCLRASRNGFRHVAIGSLIAEQSDTESSGGLAAGNSADFQAPGAGYSIGQLTRFGIDQL